MIPGVFPGPHISSIVPILAHGPGPGPGPGRAPNHDHVGTSPLLKAHYSDGTIAPVPQATQARVCCAAPRYALITLSQHQRAQTGLQLGSCKNLCACPKCWDCGHR